jgi:lipoyl(octanoyl) transferase
VSTKAIRYQWIEGLTYSEAWDLQTSIHKDLIERKRDAERSIHELPKHRMILCEHSPVYTLGKSGSIDHLLLSESDLETQGIEYFKINRGGDITYHGPGQITGYPILDLDYFFNDVHKYVRLLEECIIKTIADYGLKGERISDYTGVWLSPKGNSKKHRKICAIGVHLSRWVTLHGFALNVNTDLSYFKNIIPCGINDEDKDVTSISNELGRTVDMAEVAAKFCHYFEEIFECTILAYER